MPRALYLHEPRAVRNAGQPGPKMKLYVVGVLAAVLIVAGAVATLALGRVNVPEEFRYDFEKVYRLYDEGKFDEAASSYQELLDKYQIQSPDLYLNLANSYFKAGRIGPAVLYYKKALRLAPGDEGIAFNLKFAMEQYSLPVDSEQSWFNEKFTSFINLIPMNKALPVAVLFYWIFMLALILALFFRKRALLFSTIFMAVLFVAISAYAGIKYYAGNLHPEGVVLTETAEIMYSFEGGEKVAFTLREGSVVEILNHRNGWHQIKDADDNIGWIKSDEMGTVR
jgi:tetratricopeptide (TPR) repeat protein